MSDVINNRAERALHAERSEFGAISVNKNRLDAKPVRVVHPKFTEKYFLFFLCCGSWDRNQKNDLGNTPLISD
jgi:hypothetical protein